MINFKPQRNTLTAIYAKIKQCRKQNYSLLKFAGTLTKQESKKMLKIIREDKHAHAHCCKS